ncbi:MAG TPA: TetR/AcrR family transcriptional regulator [Conexibacter sp.]|nr:TetR/AcrR family transcriptional regulator [Conexibacter sp.]
MAGAAATRAAGRPGGGRRARRDASAEQRRPRDSRERMVCSAALLFRERGYSGTAFSDVIAHSGAPRGSIYHHFPGGKAQLAHEAVAWAAATIAERLDEALAAERDAAGVLRAFLAPWREVLERSDFRAGCPLVAITVETEVPPELRTAVSDAFVGWRELLAARLRHAGIAPARARSLATLTLSAIEGAVLLCRAQRDTAPLDAVAAELARAIDAARA